MLPDDDQIEDGMGFAGLSSLVSEVQSTSVSSTSVAATKDGGTTSAAQAAVGVPSPSANEPDTGPTAIFPTSGPSPNVGAWVIFGSAVLVIGGLIWIGSQSGSSNSNARVTSVRTAPVLQGQFLQESPDAQPPTAASFPSEIKPPVGNDHRLSVAEIRYCLAEDMRLDGAKAAVNQYRESEVDLYNAMIADYNSRCGSFQYRRGDLAQARADISPYLSSLSAQGYAQFSPHKKAATSVAASQNRTISSSTIKSVQRRLDALGYNSGYADGLMGERTRSAIRAFQRDNELPVDGSISGPFVLALQSAPSAPKDNNVSSIALTRVAGTNLVHAKRIRGGAAILPAGSLFEGHQASVILSVTVGLDGGVTSVNVKTSSGYPELDRRAVTAAENWMFSPATKNGHPVKDTLTVPVRFSADAGR